MPLTGIDVSQHQGSVDFAKVKKAGHDFVIVKSSEGQDFRDKTFNAARVDAIRKAGLTLGVYHYLRPRPGREGGVEADWAVRVAKTHGWGKPGDIPLVVDIEESDLGVAATRRYLKQFVDRYRLLMGHAPVVYSFPHFLLGLAPKDTMGCPLWIAHFDVPKPTVPLPWKAQAIWQHSSHGRCPGVSGNVDLNRATTLPKIPAKKPKPKPLTRRERTRRRMRRARAAYLDTHANRALRVFLISKARLGLWDDRYCLYYGVDPNVTDAVRGFITRGYAQGLVPTSTTGGTHAARSFHYQRVGGKGRAADMGARRDISAAEGLRRKQAHQRVEYRRFKAGRWPRAIEILGPINDQCVLAGVPARLGEGSPLEQMHDTHTHGAF